MALLPATIGGVDGHRRPSNRILPAIWDRCYECFNHLDKWFQSGTSNYCSGSDQALIAG